MRAKGTALVIALLCLVLTDAGSAAAEAPPVFTPLPVLGLGMESAAFSPDGHLLATVCICSPPLKVFTIGAGGTPTLVTERLFGSYPSPPAVAFSPDGKLLATGEPGTMGSEVWVFAVAPSGTLTTVGRYPSGAELASLAFSPDSHLLATADRWGNTVSMFTVGAGGALAPHGSFATGSSPQALAFSPDGHLLAVANWSGSSVSMFTVGADGTLAAAGTAVVSEYPKALAFSPDGHLLATADERGAPVSMFTVGAGGALTPTAAPAAGLDPGAVAFSPDGHLFAIAEHAGVSVFSVGAGGAFTPIGEPLPTGAEWPAWMAFDPLGGLLGITSTNQTSSQIGTLSLFSYPIAPPTVMIASPGGGRTFTVGQAVVTSFSCADSELGLGIASCADSNGATGGTGSLDTATAGTFTYTVTAKSRDGQTGGASIAYTVAGPTPPTPGPTPPRSRRGRTVVISGVSLSRPTVTWCRDCTYPHTKLAFRLSAKAEVRLVLEARVHGHFRELAAVTLHSKQGPNTFPVGRHWHTRFLPRRPTRLLVQLGANKGWKTEKALRLTVRRP